MSLSLSLGAQGGLKGEGAGREESFGLGEMAEPRSGVCVPFAKTGCDDVCVSVCVCVCGVCVFGGVSVKGASSPYQASGEP